PALSMARKSTFELRFRSMLTPGLNRAGVTRGSHIATIALFLVFSIPVAALRTSAVAMQAPTTAAPAQGGGGRRPAAGTAIVDQTPPTPSEMASIAGFVVREDTGAPLADATIELQLPVPTSPFNNSYETTTDSAGKFTFPSVAPTSYRLVVSTYTQGYVTTAYGQNAAFPRGEPFV